MARRQRIVTPIRPKPPIISAPPDGSATAPMPINSPTQPRGRRPDRVIITAEEERHGQVVGQLLVDQIGPGRR
jgi:hypothetical protein